MFEEMDERKGELGILNYAVSETTLEEVFLRVGEEEGSEGGKEREFEVSRPIYESSGAGREFLGVVRMRGKILWRERAHILFEIVYPCFTILLS